MGYRVDMRLDVVIPVNKVADALKTINALFGPEKLSGVDYKCVFFQDGLPQFWGVDNPNGTGGFQTLIKALEAWRYEANQTSGDVLIEEFTGEKYGDDKTLFTALAPFIQDGSFITFRGEDDKHWKWVFKDGVMKEFYGKIVYEDEK